MARDAGQAEKAAVLITQVQAEGLNLRMLGAVRSKFARFSKVSPVRSAEHAGLRSGAGVRILGGAVTRVDARRSKTTR